MAKKVSLIPHKLKDATKVMGLLSDFTNEGIIIHDKSEIIDCNEQLARMFGYTKRAFLRIAPELIVAPECRDMVFKNANKSTSLPWEAVGLKRDGSPIDIEVVGKQVVLNGRRVKISFLRDITERKALFRQVFEQRKKFRDLIECLPIGIYEYDSNMVLTYMNRKWGWVKKFC